MKALLRQITKAVIERALHGELTEQLGYDKHDPAGHNSGNSHNVITRKTMKGEFGEIELETPRDRNGEFEPKLVKKHQTRSSGTLEPFYTIVFLDALFVKCAMKDE